MVLGFKGVGGLGYINRSLGVIPTVTILKKISEELVAVPGATGS